MRVRSSTSASPSRPPHFCPDWNKNGHIEKAVKLATSWVQPQPVPGMKREIVRLEGRTPLLITGGPVPHSNAHGPIEYLHIFCAKKRTACVALVIAARARRAARLKAGDMDRTCRARAQPWCPHLLPPTGCASTPVTAHE